MVFKEFGKKIFLGVIVFIFLILGSILYIKYSDPDRPLDLTIKDIGTDIMCKISGGDIEIDKCGSACWNRYPYTNLQRIKYETTPVYPKICIAICSRNQYCNCPVGKYFASIQEGCIGESERRYPSKMDQEVFDRKIMEERNKEMEKYRARK